MGSRDATANASMRLASGSEGSAQRKAAVAGLPASGDAARDAALAQYRRRAAVYDLELALFEPIRRTAIDRLGRVPGGTVLDLGCGTGLSFELLRHAVGTGGTVVGVEQCEAMLAIARERVARRGWRNVVLIEAPVQAADFAAAGLDGPADAAIFHFTHDILQCPAALGHVARQLRPGAPVVAAGLQWAPPWLWPVNGFVLSAALHSTSSLAGLSRPWAGLAGWLDGVEVQTILAGGGFLAHGRRSSRRPA